MDQLHSESVRAGLFTVGRALVAVTVLLYAYFTLPLTLDGGRVGELLTGVLCLAVFLAIFVRQVRRIRVARYPMLRAVEALVMVAAVFVVAVAAMHVGMSSGDPSAYSEPLSRMDGLYFVVTVLATVGFGDITPETDQAKAVTTLQMVAGVVLLGAGVRVLFSVATSAKNGRAGDDAAPDDAGAQPQ